MTILNPATVSPLPGTPAAPGRHAYDVRSHRNLRGPYTAGGELLRFVVPELMIIDPELAKPASTAIVAIAPDLENAAPPRPKTLTDLAEGTERTRFYAVQRTRDLAFMVAELVKSWARACYPQGVTLRFWDLPDADPTDIQLFRTLQRRCDPLGIEILDASSFAQLVHFSEGDPAQRYIDSDGTSASPVESAAYEHIVDSDRKARHTERARLLIDQARPGTQLGAIPYHLERGEDPAEALPWLIDGQDQAFREGFYEAALDLGQRGRALLPWSENPKMHNYLTKRVIGALTYLSRCDEAMAVIDQHRRTTIEPAEQMNDAYMMAMIYTRHIDKARLDQDLALSWVNTALALAEAEQLPEKRAFFAAFMRNARALVEVHRGNVAGSMKLVNEAIDIANGLDPDKHRLHRTVLINNQARLYLAMKDHDAAIAAYDEVVARDPEYDEPYFDRAVAHKGRGDLDAALRDLNHAIELSVAFTDAYYNRADILLDLGKEELALADLNAVLDIDPDYTEALLNRAATLIGSGDLDAAEADVVRGLSLSPQHPHLWSAKGLLRTEQGNEQEALECYATALTLDPNLVEVYGNRAVLHFSAGRIVEAVADLDRAIALRDAAALRVNRAVAHETLGDTEAAMRDYDAALALPEVDAEDVTARRAKLAAARSEDPDPR